MWLYSATNRAICSMLDRSEGFPSLDAFSACAPAGAWRDRRADRPVKIAITSGARGCVLRRRYADLPAPPGLNAANTRSVAIHANDFGVRYAESAVQQGLFSVFVGSP